MAGRPAMQRVVGRGRGGKGPLNAHAGGLRAVGAKCAGLPRGTSRRTSEERLRTEFVSRALKLRPTGLAVAGKGGTGIVPATACVAVFACAVRPDELVHEEATAVSRVLL